MKITIREDFSQYPGLRNCSISDDSGEEFYHKILNDAFYNSLIEKQTLIVDIDYTAGYAPSFLDEAFGNLVFDFTKSNVEKYLDIISDQEPSWKQMIENETYVQWEQRRIDKKVPKVTKKHEPWYRMENGEILKKIWAT